MNKKALILSLVFVGTLMALTVSARRAAAGRETPSIKLGEHLVTIIACGDCHTPFKLGPNGPEPDNTRRLSGHPEDLILPEPPPLPANSPWVWIGTGTNTAFAGPWGISYSFNLTPDEDSGLGIWTEDMFVSAIRTGRHMGQSREIQPPMPWQHFAHMTDHELRSIYAYLRTIPPIHNRVPDYRAPDAVDETDL